MKLILHEVELPLRHTFTITHGSIQVQHDLIVELQDEKYSGFGEGSSIPYYGITVESMKESLESVRQEIESTSLDDPVAFWEQMAPHFKENRFALCALDQAAHDLWGKRRGQPVYQLWGLNLEKIPASNYTIGIDTIEKMVAKMEEFPGWPVYKIKLGTDDDLRIIRELRKHTTASFRVDANTAWSAQQTIENSRELAKLNVEFIEQPLPADCLQEMRQVFAESALPVIADESCIIEEDVDRCQGHFHGINIKLTKCGGLTPARRMIDRARQLGMQVMVGCMTESTVGISSIAQLLPLLDYVDMDGALLLAKDVASGVRLEKGYAVFPKENGCGVRFLSQQRCP